MKTKRCKFAILDKNQPDIKTCVGESGKIGSGPEDGCGLEVRTTAPLDKLRGPICGQTSNPPPVFEDRPNPLPQHPTTSIQHIGLGDLAELSLWLLSFGMDKRIRQQRYVRVRNFIFGSSFVRNWLGLRVTLGKTCGCDSRRKRWNGYGHLVVPFWARWMFPHKPLPIVQIKLLPTSEQKTAPVVVPVEQPCSCPGAASPIEQPSPPPHTEVGDVSSE